MSDRFFDNPILNSPYELPKWHHHLDAEGQPTDLPPQPLRRKSDLITPVPKPKKKGKAKAQQEMVLGDPLGLSSAEVEYSENSRLELTPELVGSSRVLLEGIAREGVTLDVKHVEQVRFSTIAFELATQLLYSRFRDPGEEPKLHLLGQLKRITRRWLDGGYLKCSGGTFPAQLPYREMADKAVERIVEIKGYRGGDAQLKAETMQTLWIPGVNNPGRFGRWAFAEFNQLFEIEKKFAELIAGLVRREEAA